MENNDENLSVDEPEVVEIQSLCMNCHADGMTRLMATKIPFYKEVVVMSFTCDVCGYENNELKSCGVISEKGIKIVLEIQSNKDLNRKCVRTEYADILIPEVELEISAENQKGDISTIEGIIDRVIEGLQQDQVVRRIEHPEDAQKIDLYILRLEKLKDVEKNGPYRFIISDISGNSYIENPNAPLKDDKLTISYFQRTAEQNHKLGYFTQDEVQNKDEEKLPEKKPNMMKDTLLQPIAEGEHSYEELQEGEVLTFRTNCPDCNAPCDTNMKMTCIPHFKEVLIMATTCDKCGHRTNEVKSGGGIEEHGVRIEMKIRHKDDFSRDILKSDTCSLIIPELELESGSGSLCGRFTTTEGLLTAMKIQLASKESILAGDSVDPSTSGRVQNFLKKLDEVLENKMSITLILDDPAGNSYVQTLNDDGTPDEGLTITKYERNFEHNEELGLNDMKTDNYQN